MYDRNTFAAAAAKPWGLPRGCLLATKAFCVRAMARVAHEEGMRSTWPPAATGPGVAAGVPAADLLLHGNNKSDEE